MGKRVVDDESLAIVAETIRAKTGTSDKLVFPEGYSAGVENAFIAGEQTGISNAFSGDWPLGDFYNEQLKSVTSYAFFRRANMTGVTLPNLKDSGTYAFCYCSGLTKAVFPAYCSGNTEYMFYYCINMKFVDLGFAKNLASSALKQCEKLEVLVLRSKELVSLAGSAVFANTPFMKAGSGCEIYVPSTLIAKYKQATNWSALYGYGGFEFQQKMR